MMSSSRHGFRKLRFLTIANRQGVISTTGLKPEARFMRRFFAIAGICVLICILISAGTLYRWTFTPYGRLDVEVALILKLMPRTPPFDSVPISQLRQQMRDAARRFQGRPIPILHVEDRS